MRVPAADIVRGAVQREVEDPEGGAEGVGETRGAFVVERVGFAEDEGEGSVVGGGGGGEGEDGGPVGELVGNGGGGGGVVHEGTL